ncbi:MAG: hypothetical protein GF308_06595 [Candidatus Heimdallarchaeota archaeon]|nr:hypothetical protein [Candidatus Heimdallarchaeota archaeon]
MMKSKIKIMICLIVVINFVAITCVTCESVNQGLPGSPGDPGNGSTPGVKWQQTDNPTIIKNIYPLRDSVDFNFFHFIENCLTSFL